MTHSLPRPTVQDIRDEVIALLAERHRLDSFEIREMLGMLFCQAVVADVRRGAITDPKQYLHRFAETVTENLDAP